MTLPNYRKLVNKILLEDVKPRVLRKSPGLSKSDFDTPKLKIRWLIRERRRGAELTWTISCSALSLEKKFFGKLQSNFNPNHLGSIAWPRDKWKLYTKTHFMLWRLLAWHFSAEFTINISLRNVLNTSAAFLPWALS